MLGHAELLKHLCVEFFFLPEITSEESSPCEKKIAIISKKYKLSKMYVELWRSFFFLSKKLILIKIIEVRYKKLYVFDFQVTTMRH